MHTLHIVQGGIKNGDKRRLERAAKERLTARSWIVPKSAAPGDEVVFYVGRYGFFATGQIKSLPAPRKDWPHRYGAAVSSISLISPAISLGIIRRRVPKLTWAIYPRGVTTPPPRVAAQIRELVKRRKREGVRDLDVRYLEEVNVDELREAALLRAARVSTRKERKAIRRIRSEAIRRFILSRADGHCEACHAPAPFRTADGELYLENHHPLCLADGGPDHPRNAIALCPNCHRRTEFSEDRARFNESLIKRAALLFRQR